MHPHLRERTVPFTSVPLSFISLNGVADFWKKFSLSGCANLDGIEINKGGYSISPSVALREFSLRLLYRHCLR